MVRIRIRVRLGVWVRIKNNEPYAPFGMTNLGIMNLQNNEI